MSSRFTAEIDIREGRTGLGFRAKKKTQAPPPFSCQIQKRRLHLSVPSYARVQIRKSLSWETLHSGENWAPNGVLACASHLDLDFPLDVCVRVGAQGRTWKIQLRSQLPPKAKSPFLARLREQRFLAYSIAFHGLLFLTLIGLMALPKAKQTSPAVSAQAITLSETLIGPDGRPLSRPFSGISYAEFRRRLIGSGRAGDPMNAVMKSLSGLDFGGTGKVASAAPAGLSPLQAQLAAASASPSKSVSEEVAARKFTDVQSPDKGPSNRKLSEADQTKVRQLFRGFQEAFKRAYSQALASDPNLAVTVSFEATVLDSGYLTLSQFNARGNYQSDALAQLKSGMASIVQSAFVGKNLSGTVIRGENVFVR